MLRTAGKTTALRMLTGDLAPTSGDAIVGGAPMTTDRKEAYRTLGYTYVLLLLCFVLTPLPLVFFSWAALSFGRLRVCVLRHRPQHDALFDLLTGAEVLQFYARIKGLNPDMVPGLVDAALAKLDLTKYKDQQTKEYSGGNKRKLSLCVALLGGSKTMFLDEPSTGVDPVSRRALAEVIKAARGGRSIILTTHLLDEADLICTRIAIMVRLCLCHFVILYFPVPCVFVACRHSHPLFSALCGPGCWTHGCTGNVAALEKCVRRRVCRGSRGVARARGRLEGAHAVLHGQRKAGRKLRRVRAVPHERHQAERSVCSHGSQQGTAGVGNVLCVPDVPGASVFAFCANAGSCRRCCSGRQISDIVNHHAHSSFFLSTRIFFLQ